MSGLLIAVAIAACTGDAPQEPLQPTGGSGAVGAAAFVEITPQETRVAVAGETVDLALEVRDSRGKRIDGRLVSWTSLDPALARIDGAGRVVTLAKGTARIQAKVDAVADTARVVVESMASVASVRITPDESSIAVGGSVGLFGAAYDGAGRELANAPVTWQSLDGTVASVSSGGNVLGLAVGTARIVASHLSVSDTATVGVSGGAAAIEIAPKFAQITAVGGTVQLGAFVRDAQGGIIGGQGIVWASLDPAIVTVQAGLALGIAQGDGRVTATLGALMDTAVVSVGSDESGATVQITPPTDTIPAIGGSVQLQADVTGSNGTLVQNATVSWSSLDPSIVAVTGPGRVAAAAKGVGRVIARYGTSADTAAIWVAPAPPAALAAAVRVQPETDTIPAVGGMVQLLATVLDTQGQPISGKTVQWSSLNASTATVNASGVVTGLASGTARIVATHSGLADTATVVVAPAPPAPQPAAVRVQPETDTIPTVGGTVQLLATVLDSQGQPMSGKTVQWSSLNAANATVDASGLVTGVANGAAKIMAAHGGFADTATVVVASSTGDTQPVQRVVVTHGDTVITVGTVREQEAFVYDANGNKLTVLATWTTLDPGVVTSSATGASRWSEATAVGAGVGRIVASYNGAADTVRYHVSSAPAAQANSVRVTPKNDTIPALGSAVTLSAKVLDATGRIMPGLNATWASLDGSIASVTASGVVTGVGKGTARIVASYQTLKDTAHVFVDDAPAAQPASVEITPQAATISNIGLITSLSATVRDATGKIMPGLNVTWSSLDVTIASVNASGVVTGAAQGTARIVATYQTLRDTAQVLVQQVTFGGSTGLLTPANLIPSAGALMGRPASQQAPVSAFDARYAAAELATYNAWVKAGRQGADGSSHYGALRSRYQWSLRNGLPVGPGAASTSTYAHGVEMTRAVITKYLAVNGYTSAPHNLTLLPDVEILWRIEGDTEAEKVLRTTADFYSRVYGETYLDLSGSNSDPRSSAILLQALSLGERLGMPYRGRWGATWKEAADVMVGRMASKIIGGKVVSLAHKNTGQGEEAFFMNAMLATELLRWHGFVEPQPGWVSLAQQIVDHLIDEHNRRGAACLPYMSKGSGCAADLAAFYVWPALVLWQETGDAKYQAFALANIKAAQTAFLAVKQFNQAYSTGAQTAEALLAGVHWR